jgi:hypothetical protein
LEPNFLALYDKSKELTSDAFGVITKYEAVTQRVADMGAEGLLENKWTTEDKEIIMVVGAGQKVGVGKYKAILSLRSKDSEEVLHDEHVVEAMEKQFYTRAEEEVDGAWGKIAKKQVKAAKRLFKAFTSE